jgi:hypothetical protein
MSNYIDIPRLNPVFFRPYNTTMKRTEIGVDSLFAYEEYGIGIKPYRNWSEIWTAGKSIKFQIWIADAYDFNASGSYVYSYAANGTEVLKIAFDTISTDITPGVFGPAYTVYDVVFPMPSDPGKYILGLEMTSSTLKSYFYATDPIEIIPPEYFEGFEFTNKELFYMQLDYSHYENIQGMLMLSDYTMFLRASLNDEDSESGSETYENDRGNSEVTQITPKQIRNLVTEPMPIYFRENLEIRLGLSELTLNNHIGIVLSGDITKNDFQGSNVKSIIAPVQISDFDGFVKQYDADQYYITNNNPVIITEDDEIGITNNE